MPRYIIERDYPEGLNIPVNIDGARICGGIAARNMGTGVTWVQSFVSLDRKRTYCVYDGPSSEAIRRAAEANAMPVGKITEVRVLDPNFYH